MYTIKKDKEKGENFSPKDIVIGIADQKNKKQ